MNYLNKSGSGSSWDFKGKLDFVDQWFLMSSPVPMVAITLSYIILVLKIGPAFMKWRPPYSLKNIIVLYNVLQVFASFYMFYLCSRLMWPNGFVSKTCLLERKETRESLATIMYYYFLAKVSELLDTIFFILRKKDNQVTFLHVYHHAMMVVTSWSILKYEPTYPTIFIRNINSFVHVIMYSYYGLSAFPSLAKYLWWKKYITKLQLVQFTLILIHFVMTYTTSECVPSYPLCLTITINASLFIFLFGRFYLKTYSKNDNKTKNKQKKYRSENMLDGNDKNQIAEETRIVGNNEEYSTENTNGKHDLHIRKTLMTGNR